MQLIEFPVIDLAATGRNITRLRKARGLTVRDVQAWFGFEEPQAIYKWQGGKSLPTVDNLYALSTLLKVPMDEILVSAGREADMDESGQQAESCCSDFIAITGSFRYDRSPSHSHQFRRSPLAFGWSSHWQSGFGYTVVVGGKIPTYGRGSPQERLQTAIHCGGVSLHGG